MKKYFTGLAVALITAFLAWFFRPEIMAALPLGLSGAAKAFLSPFGGGEQLVLIAAIFAAIWTVLALIFIWAVPGAVVVVKATFIAVVVWIGAQMALSEPIAWSISVLVWAAVLVAAFNGETKRQNPARWDMPTSSSLRWGRILAAVGVLVGIVWLAAMFQTGIPTLLVLVVIFLAAIFVGRNYFFKPGKGHPVNNRTKKKKK